MRIFVNLKLTSDGISRYNELLEINKTRQKKAPNRCTLFQVGYGQSLILTCCVVSNGHKTYFLYDIIEYFKNEGIFYGE